MDTAGSGSLNSSRTGDDDRSRRPCPSPAPVYESRMDRRHRDTLASVWPLFGLELRTGRVELRVPLDDDLVVLAGLAGDIHDPWVRPLAAPWVSEEGPARARALLQHHWNQRAAWSAEDWDLDLAVWADGELCGVQTLRARSFPVRRTVSTSSWLHRAAQGRGIGTEMRRAVLALAFGPLGAARAESEVSATNDASIAVAAKLGYRPNGDDVRVDRGGQRVVRRFVLDVDRWAHDPTVEVRGVEPCLELLGRPVVLAAVG